MDIKIGDFFSFLEVKLGDLKRDREDVLMILFGTDVINEDLSGALS